MYPEIVYFNKQSWTLDYSDCDHCEEVEIKKPLEKHNTKEIRNIIKDLVDRLLARDARIHFYEKEWYMVDDRQALDYYNKNKLWQQKN